MDSKIVKVETLVLLGLSPGLNPKARVDEPPVNLARRPVLCDDEPERASLDDALALLARDRVDVGQRGAVLTCCLASEGVDASST